MAGREALSLKEFLVESFQQVGRKTASKFIHFLGLDPRRKICELSRDEISRISAVMKSYDHFNLPDSSSLSPINRRAFLSAVAGLYEPDYSFYASRGPLEWEGHPFIVEGIIASSKAFSKGDEPILYRFANRVPLLYDASDDILTKALKRVSWSRYGIPAGQPWALFISFCSTRVPYQAAGKQSISNLVQIESAALALYRELGRGASKMTKKRQRSRRLEKRMREMEASLRMIARFSADLADADAQRAEQLATEVLWSDRP